MKDNPSHLDFIGKVVIHMWHCINTNLALPPQNTTLAMSSHQSVRGDEVGPQLGAEWVRGCVPSMLAAGGRWWGGWDVARVRVQRIMCGERRDLHLEGHRMVQYATKCLIASFSSFGLIRTVRVTFDCFEWVESKL